MNYTHNNTLDTSIQLTHEGSKVEGSLLLPVDSLDVSSLEQEQREHIKMAVVGSMVEGSLASTITNVKVTKMRYEDLCVCVWGGGVREGWREIERL